MAEGKKYGGRVKGTPNKSTKSVTDKLAALGCDPIEGMARLAKIGMDEGDYEMAHKNFKELAQYSVPKRKAVEVDLNAKVSADIDIMTDGELILQLAELGLNDPDS